ncbi:MAG TPA: permease [Aggregatilineales bacterium]|nr:permease [Anaerolineales bacterium]HRE48362.1 permease [Aggregatilineales bacterium]
MDIATQLQLFTTRFLGIFIEAVSFLLLGTLVSGLIEVFVRQEDMLRLLPRRRLPAILTGACLGFLFPVCECGVVPVARRLYQKGLPPAVGITFLLAAPVMNPIVLASTFSAFGWGTVLVGRYVITMLIAVSVGLLFSLQSKPQRMLAPQAYATLARGGGGDPADAPTSSRESLLAALLRALRLAGDEFFDVGRYLVIGCALAAGMQIFIPQETLRTISADPVVSVFVMALLAFVLSVCSTTDAIIALSFANPATGFTTGSILTFLTFGPMVDIKSLLMYLSVYRRRTVIYMAMLPLLIAVFIGIWLNLNVRF